MTEWTVTEWTVTEWTESKNWTESTETYEAKRSDLPRRGGGEAPGEKLAMNIERQSRSMFMA